MKVPRPFIYDIIRTLRRRSTFLLVIGLVVLSLISIPSFSPRGSSQQAGPITQVFGYYDSAGYHFDCFAWNEFGQPVSGTGFFINISEPASSPSASVITNSSGTAEALIPTSYDKDYGVGVSITDPNGLSGGFAKGEVVFANFFPNGTITTSIPAGQPVVVWGNEFALVSDTASSQNTKLLVTWIGENGTAPINYSVYYAFFSSFGNYPAGNESNLKFLGKLNSFHALLSTPTLEPGLQFNETELAVGLFYPNGTEAGNGIRAFALSQVYPPPAPPISSAQGNNLILNFFEQIFGLLIPIAAIFAGYSSYGKDRVSGVLDSVLVKPISRRGLSVSRFLSAFFAMSLATFLGLGLADLIAFYYSRSFVSGDVIAYSAISLAVEIAAFLGIMMLTSRIVQSSGILIGIGVAMFVILDLFWFLILIAAISIFSIHGVLYYQILIDAQFFNPAQFIGLVGTYLTHTISYAGIGGGYGLPVTPSDYGVTIISLSMTGILWIAIPLSLFLYLSVWRD